MLQRATGRFGVVQAAGPDEAEESREGGEREAGTATTWETATDARQRDD